MAYANAVVNTPADAPQALVDAIDAVFAAHANWTFIEQITDSTYTWRIYGHNTRNMFIFFGKNSAAATTVAFAASEEYNSATNVMSKPCPVMSGTHATDANTCLTGTFAPSNASVQKLTCTVNTTAFEYFISLTTDRLVVGTRVSTTMTGVYVGWYNSLMTLSDPQPLCIMSFPNANATNTNNGGTCSRHPGRVSQGADAAHFKLQGLQNASNTNWTQGVGRLNDVLDHFFGAALLARIALWSTAATLATTGATSMHIYGYLRGLLYDMLTTVATDSGVAIGDTVTIGSDVYVCLYMVNLSSTPGVWVNSSA